MSAAWRARLLTLLLLAVVAAGCGSAPSPSTPASRLTPGADPATQGVRGLYVLPEDGYGPILAELDAAGTSIEVAVYLLNDERVIEALLTAEDRGVDVRVILDPAPYGGAGDSESVVRRLRSGGIEVRWGVESVRFTHVKSIVVDDTVALILNANLTEASFVENREFGVITTDPADVAHAAALFDADWRGVPPPAGPLVLSPDSSRAVLTGLIQRASASIDIYAEVVRDPAIVAQLVAAARRGVVVRLIVRPDAGPAFASILAELLSGGVAVGLLSNPYTHAKAISIDGARLFVGSQNLTSTSLDANRELGLVVSEIGILQRFAAVFARDWSMALPAGASPVVASPAAPRVAPETGADLTGVVQHVPGERN